MANFFFNELAFIEKISDKQTLNQYLHEFITFHNTILSFNHTPYLHRAALYECELLGVSFQSALANNCDREIVRKVRQVVDRTSPALPDDGLLDDSITIQWNNKNIHNTALGECAARIHISEGDNSCYSVKNSSFKDEFLDVIITDNETVTIKVPNINGIECLQSKVASRFPALTKWEDIFTKSNVFLKKINFENYVLEELKSQPFLKNVAEDIYSRLEELNEMASASPENFQELYQKYCHGEKAHFSDSSDDEKRDFKEELSFYIDDNKVLCPFHGKVKNKQFRIHIVETPKPQSLIRVVYIGPKLTKK